MEALPLLPILSTGCPLSFAWQRPPSPPGRLSTCHHCRSNRRHIGPSSIQGRQGMKSPLKTLIR